jgi:hypothetical protein
MSSARHPEERIIISIDNPIDCSANNKEVMINTNAIANNNICLYNDTTLLNILNVTTMGYMINTRHGY